jgi:molybdate-binding protein/DNA-binding XRE family transcriptional regulator
LRQQDLAVRVGISRQSLSTLEAGRSVPSAAVALRLAQALGCQVEDLFWVDGARAAVTVEVARHERDEAATTSGRVGARGAGVARVALASIEGRWIAHPLASADSAAYLTAADAILAGPVRGADRTARATWLGDELAARRTLVCAGCAPAFGILAARASGGGAGDRVLWLERSSSAALDLLASGHVHVAGAHLYDEATDDFNVAFVERRLRQRPMLVVNLARWEAGIVVAPGNPRRVRGVKDLARADVAVVQRQAGSAAQDLLMRLARREGLGDAALAAGRAGVVARSHGEVARLVALGVGDAGIALAATARAHGLDFIPLCEERFDLILAREVAADPRAQRLLETLGSRAFRREMESLGGHVARDAGKVIAETRPLA